MKILLTGVTGFVGRRLLDAIFDEEVEINLLVRNPNKLEQKVKERCNIFAGDTFNQEILEKALKGVDVAVYLIHMMGQDEDYLNAEKNSAKNLFKLVKNVRSKK